MYSEGMLSISHSIMTICFLEIILCHLKFENFLMSEISLAQFFLLYIASFDDSPLKFKIEGILDHLDAKNHNFFDKFKNF